MISKDDVRYIAHLSRINLNDKEIDRLAKTLEDILHYINKLNNLDVKDVKPTSHVLPLKNVYRKDAVKPSLAQEEVVGMTQHKDKGFFKVPPVIE